MAQITAKLWALLRIEVRVQIYSETKQMLGENKVCKIRKVQF
mgnify:CR=1 FL=1